MAPPTALAGLLWLSVTLGAGCAAKKNLDHAVDALVEAVQKNDYAAFRKMSHDSLVTQFPKAKFAEFSKALNRLGALRDRTMKGIHVKSGGIRKGNYVLRFERGKVRLKLELKGGKLIAFYFTGDDLMRALKAVRNAKYATFKVGRFQWRTPDGKPKTDNLFPAGKLLRFAFEVWGLTRKGDHLDVRASLQVKQGDAVLLDKPRLLDKPIPLPADAPPIATVRGQFTPKHPGLYTLRLVITDKASGRSLTHQQAFQVTGGAPDGARPAGDARPATKLDK